MEISRGSVGVGFRRYWSLCGPGLFRAGYPPEWLNPFNMKYIAILFPIHLRKTLSGFKLTGIGVNEKYADLQ